jgi:hypothetical protein
VGGGLFQPFKHPRAIDLRQREPATNDADYRADQKPQTEKVDREDRRKHGGMLVNPVLEIHARQLSQFPIPATTHGLSDWVPARNRVPQIHNVGLRICLMAKKTEMSGSSLWIVTIVLLALAVWMYFKR